MSKQFGYTSDLEEESQQNVNNLLQAINSIPRSKLGSIVVSTEKGKRIGKHNIDELLPKLSQNIRNRIKNDIASVEEDLEFLGLNLVFSQDGQVQTVDNEKSQDIEVQTVDNRRSQAAQVQTVDNRRSRGYGNNHTQSRANNRQHGRTRNNTRTANGDIHVSRGTDSILGPAPEGIDDSLRVNAFMKYEYGVSGIHHRMHDHFRGLPDWVRLCYCSDRKDSRNDKIVSFFEYVLLRNGSSEDLKTRLRVNGISMDGYRYELTIVENKDMAQFPLVKYFWH